jgi:hypothetical protein
MIGRREFVTLGALTALSPRMYAASGSSGPTHLPYHSLVYDDRFAEPVAFGRAAARAGFQVSAVQGDVTALWYDNLYHRWLADRAPVAGLTTPDALFCLETLGNDAGLRLVMRVDHLPRTGAIEHRMLMPVELAADASLDHCASDWGRHMVDLVRACPATRREPVSRTIVTPVVDAIRDRPALVTWVLAPHARRPHG